MYFLSIHSRYAVCTLTATADIELKWVNANAALPFFLAAWRKIYDSVNQSDGYPRSAFFRPAARRMNRSKGGWHGRT
jgi:hypothetical protein